MLVLYADMTRRKLFLGANTIPKHRANPMSNNLEYNRQPASNSKRRVSHHSQPVRLEPKRLPPRNSPHTRPRLQPQLPKAIIIRVPRPPPPPSPIVAFAVATPRKQRIRAGAMPAVAPPP